MYCRALTWLGVRIECVSEANAPLAGMSFGGRRWRAAGPPRQPAGAYAFPGEHMLLAPIGASYARIGFYDVRQTHLLAQQLSTCVPLLVLDLPSPFALPWIVRQPFRLPGDGARAGNER